jgi:hypothetical protein
LLYLQLDIYSMRIHHYVSTGDSMEVEKDLQKIKWHLLMASPLAHPLAHPLARPLALPLAHPLAYHRLPYIKALPMAALSSITMFGAGFALCLTGIGAIAGIPMLVMGFLGFILSPILAFMFAEGRCPHCGQKLYFPLYRKVVRCRYCKQRCPSVKGRLIPLAK